MLQSLSAFNSRWSNFLKTVTITWWGSHSFCLLSVYRLIICTKLDYGCFPFASQTNWSKINKIQITCHGTIMEHVKSTPRQPIKIESIYPPFNFRCQWLAGKLILKSLAHSNHFVFDTYYSLFLNWRYTPKSNAHALNHRELLSIYYELKQTPTLWTNIRLFP